MARLSDTQLTVLSNAAASDDGAATPPARLNAAALTKVGASLVSRKLMREIRSKPGMTIWRGDGDGRTFSLIITRAGRDAVDGGDVAANRTVAPMAAAEKSTFSADQRDPTIVAEPVVIDRAFQDTRTEESKHEGSMQHAGVGARAIDARDLPNTVALPRTESKQALVIGMLKSEAGATIDALVAATGWLPHTTRAALTGFRKRGFSLERRREDGVTTYRIVDQAAKTAA